MSTPEQVWGPDDTAELAAQLAGKGEPAQPIQEIRRRHYSIVQTYRNDDPILTDRYRLERQLTDLLLKRMRDEGVDVNPDTWLPGFVLAPDPGMPDSCMEARISCDVAILPRAVWPHG